MKAVKKVVADNEGTMLQEDYHNSEEEMKWF